MKKLRGKTRSQQLAADKTRGPHGRTQQQFKEDADLNVIMQRYTKNNPRDPLGFGLGLQLGFGQSGDSTLTLDLASAMNAVNEATDQFLQLPSDLRDRFANDPSKLAAFLSDPANQEEAYKLGLAARPVPPPEPVPVKVHVVQTDLVEAAGKGPEGPKNAPKGGD